MLEQLTLTGDVESLWDQEFDEWWQGYPVKRDKAPARRRFRARRRQGVTLADLVRARDHYLAQAEAPYIKYPATFLGVWDEWAVPPDCTQCHGAGVMPEGFACTRCGGSGMAPDSPDPARNDVLSPPARTEVSFCPGCGELKPWCYCGVPLHRP